MICSNKTNIDHKIELIRSLFKGTLDINNIEQYAMYFADNCRIHFFQDEFNLAYGKKFDADLANAFDLIHLEINDIFSREDSVYVYWTFQVIHKGIYQKISATFKELTLKGMSIYKVFDQKIVEIWQFWDRLGLIEQIKYSNLKGKFDFQANCELLKSLGQEELVIKSSKLSHQERQCLKILLEGKTIKEIAVVLSLSHRTVEHYFNNIKDKLGFLNKKELFTAAKILEKLEML